MGTLKVIGSALYQWEIGRKIRIDASVGNRAVEVQFAHPGDKEALSVIPKEENGIIVAEVPNIMLQSADKLLVFLVEMDENCVETTRHSVFHVVNRPKPADYLYTETEILSYRTLEQRIDQIEKNGVSDEQIATAVEKYLDKNPSQGGATEEEKAQIQQNKTDIEKLTKDKLDAEKLPEAVNEALAQAKESGEFKGEPGKTPVKGTDYFTTAEVQAIAEQAAGMVEVPEGDTVELDTTLTAQGKAADAKSVGDALNGKLSKSGGTMTGKIVFPTGNQNVGFANSQDMKIFGYGAIDGAVHMRMGDTQYPFQIRGNGERPKYNDGVIALIGDIPTDDHINDLIHTALGVIEHGTY